MTSRDFQQIKRRIGNGSAPGQSPGVTSPGPPVSVAAKAPVWPPRSENIRCPAARKLTRLLWTYTDDSLGDPTATTESDNGSSFGPGGRKSNRSKDGGGGNEKEDVGGEDFVDEVVVEATGSPEFWKAATQRSDRSRGENGTGTGAGTTGIPGTGMQSEGSSLRHTYDAASGMFATVGGFLRWRLYPIIL